MDFLQGWWFSILEFLRILELFGEDKFCDKMIGGSSVVPDSPQVFASSFFSNLILLEI